MDRFDKSHSDGTYRIVRGEHLLVVVVCSALAITHFHEIDAWRFALLFVAIDAVGYLPGRIAYLRSAGGAIAPLYHHLYNLTHSYLTWGLGALAWSYCLGWDWTLLAVAIHLSGDRAIFGNVLKPADRPFEPTPRSR